MSDRSLLITGGRVVNANFELDADVFIEGGIITALVERGARPRFSTEDFEVVEADGMLVMPGGVDPHCHVGFTSGGYTSLDNYAGATRAAVLGGTTTIVDFAIPGKGERPLEAVIRQRDLAEGGYCDSALHACVVSWDAQSSNELDVLAAQGIVTVKLFTTYSGDTMADESTILKTLTHLRSTGGLAYVHAESNSLVESSQLDAVERNQISAGFHGETRSELAEVAAVRTVLDLAEAAGAPVYFVHQSTPAAIEAVREARNRGLRVFSETVVHHLVLDDAVYEGDCPELYVCCPPIRSKNSMLRVGELLVSGHVDTVGSDHCCYDTQQKTSSKSDVRTMPNGLPGVETRLPVLFSQFVTTGRMTAMKFVELSSANPARLNGLFPRKGLIAPGSDADIVLWDPSAKVTLRSSDLHMATDFTPYEGISVTGRPIAAFVRGRSVVRKGEFIDSAPRGRHVKASPVFLPKEAS